MNCKKYICTLLGLLAMGTAMGQVSVLRINKTALHVQADANPPPVITVQPQSRTVKAGTNAVLSVTAVGSEPLTYQWRRNGANLSNGINILGATSPNVIIVSARLEDSGNYDVVVTDTVGSTASATAVLTLDFSWAGQWPDFTQEPAWGVVSRDGYAYCALGDAGLAIVDITDPVNPRRVGGLDTSGFAWGVAVSGNYAYVADEDAGLEVIDITNPANPQRVGGFDTSGLALGVAVSGNYAYVADEASGLQVINIANPANPQLVGGIVTLGYALGVTVSGHYAYVADDDAGLQIIDVANPANPKRVGGFVTAGYALGVAVSGNYAYVADDFAGLQVIRITNPANPQRVGGLDTSGLGLDVAVSGNYLYLADDYAGLEVVDISTPANPQLVGNYETSGSAAGVAAFGGYALVADDYAGLQVIDLTDPGSPRRIGGYDTTHSGEGVAVSGNYAYLADGEAGLQVIDITNPANPRRVGAYDTSGTAWGVAVSGNYAYVADDDAGLQVIDITNPANPQRVGRYDTSGYAYGVAISGHYAYVADGFAGLQVIDITNPANPQRVGGFVAVDSGLAYGVAVSGNYAYVADEDAGLQVIDITNPANPHRVGTFNTGGSAWSVTVSGHYAYVADGLAGLQVIDVANPASPQRVGGFDTSGSALGVSVSGNYAYVADKDAGLQVIDITDPSNPRRVGGFDTSAFSEGVTVSGSYAYLADADNGLQIINLFKRAGGTPTITCPADIVQANDLGFCAATVNFTVTASDSLPGVTAACVPAPNSLFPIGTTTVTCTATSTSGSTATCGFQVTVVDGEKPSFIQPLDIVRDIEQAQTVTAVDFLVTATDNCPGVTTVCLPPSGSAFPPGVSFVTCTATDAAQNMSSTTFTVTVRNGPAIVSRPGSQSVLVGQTAAFSVIADGAGPLLYQWKFNGANLINKTSDTLMIPNAQAVNAGDYQVAVSNPFGSVLSGVATLRVLLPPVLTRQPADASVRLDSPVTFCAEATGTPPLQFQWRKSGVNIAGATDSCYTLPKVRIEDGGQYSVVVTSEAGSVVSGTARLIITELPNGPPAEDNFANRFELFGASGVVSVNNIGATKEAGEPDHAGKPGGSSVWYNWRAPAKGIATFRTSGSSFDTLLAAYSGRSVDSLLLLDSDEDRGGYLASEVHFNTQADALYQVAIDGYANSQGNFVLSWNFQATAEELPTLTAQPKSQTVAKGAAALLQVVATGQDLNYQWSLNGAPLAGAVSSSLSIPQVRPADVGTYTVRVANGQRRSVDSRPAVLEIGAVNVQSQDKLEDLFLAPAPNPLAVLKASASAAGSASVRAGTIGSHTLNNSSSTNSGRAEVNALCGLVGANRRWVELRAEDGGILSVDTQGSAIDTLLGVFTYDLGADLLVPVRCDDNGAPDGRSSLVRFSAVPGTDYLIGVDGAGGETGVVNLNWSLGVPLTVRQQGNALLLSWPASFVGFVLEENSGIPETAKPPAWPRSPGVPTVVNGTNTQSLPLSRTTKFYRLRQP